MSESQTRDLGIHTGDVLAGKYRVTRILGTGAMGVVVAAHHEQLDSNVAIKLLLPELLANDAALARFSLEAKAVAKLTNEHVARVLDVGTLENGVPYMVMEYLEGEDLADRLAREGPLPIEQAVEFVVHACVAVAEAHSVGIVHCDLKPANLFCVRRPDDLLSIKVLDFGISKLTVAGEAPPRSPAPHHEVAGSPLYMSPEQTTSAMDTDAQTDVWALGVILYEVLTGHVPFYGESEVDIATQIGSQPARPPHELRPDVPAPLEAVILKCLEKEKAQRYLNVGDLARDLAPFAPARALGAIERISGTVERARAAADEVDFEFDVDARPVTVRPPAPAGDRNAATVVRQPTQRSSQPPVATAAVVGAVLGLLVVGGAVLFLARGVPTLRPTLSAAPPAAAAPDTSGADGVARAAAVASVPSPPVADSALAEGPPDVPPAASAEGAQKQPSAASTPARARRAFPNPRSSPNCDVPYTLDGEGRKHFKPECFLKK